MLRTHSVSMIDSLQKMEKKTPSTAASDGRSADWNARPSRSRVVDGPLRLTSREITQAHREQRQACAWAETNIASWDPFTMVTLLSSIYCSSPNHGSWP